MISPSSPKAVNAVNAKGKLKYFSFPLQKYLNLPLQVHHAVKSEIKVKSSRKTC